VNQNFFTRLYRFIKARYAPRGARASFSASGEDIAISDILKKLGVREPLYIDIGAHHPVFGNNTYLLYKQGGSGVIVEPNDELCSEARDKRPRDRVVNAGAGKSDGEADFYLFPMKSTRSSFSKDQADKWVSESGQKPIVEKRNILSLDTIINSHLGARVPDVVSIDAEGLDLEILSGFSWRVKPRVFCIEMSPGIEDMMLGRGYELVAKMFQNSIFKLKTQ